MAVREFYYYLFQTRQSDTTILCTGRLGQPFEMDFYVKIERQRLDYLINEQINQQKRIELFEGVIESVMIDADSNGAQIGKNVFCLHHTWEALETCKTDILMH